MSEMKRIDVLPIGSNVRFRHEKNVVGIITQIRITGMSGHVQYCVCWLANGVRQEQVVEEHEITAELDVKQPIGFRANPAEKMFYERKELVEAL